MKRSYKVKPQIVTETENESERDWRARDPNVESIPVHECRLYGYAGMPGESMNVYRILADVKQNNAHKNWCESIRIEFPHELDHEHEFHADISLDQHHACTCHKLACLMFFQWDGSKYIQVPLMSSMPNSKYVILGEVSDIEKIY